MSALSRAGTFWLCIFAAQIKENDFENFCSKFHAQSILLMLKKVLPSNLNLILKMQYLQKSRNIAAVHRHTWIIRFLPLQSSPLPYLCYITCKFCLKAFAEQTWHCINIMTNHLVIS